MYTPRVCVWADTEQARRRRAVEHVVKLFIVEKYGEIFGEMQDD